MQQQQQPPHGGAAVQLVVAELEQATAAVQSLLRSVRIMLLTGDLKRVLTGKATFAGRFAAATVGHRHVHMLGPEMGLAGVMRPGAPVIAETAANMVQLSNEQVAAFEGKLVELAATAGFQRHPAFETHVQVMPSAKQPQQQQQQQHTEGRWHLPPGHVAFGTPG
jgi:hypothetical protein